MKLKPESFYDVVVIGGGINGVGIAADAQGRGLSVLLCEQDDLASGTSSRSSKMIHGGLRYLAQYQFSLVRDALQERQKLFHMAPHLVSPQTFVIPHRKGLQPFWLLRAGLFCYDLLGARKPFARSQHIKFEQLPYTDPLQHCFTHDIQTALSYTDATCDDARLVITNALRFKALGGTVLTRTTCIEAKNQSQQWQITLQDQKTQQKQIITAKALVNAAGPWVSPVIENCLQSSSEYSTRLVKGSHIVIRNRAPKAPAFLLPHPDGRVIFVIPYHHDFTMIGTTDIAFSGDPSQIRISPEEIDYLCDIVNSYLRHRISRDDIVHTWSGVRTLIHEENTDPAQNSREYKLTCHSHHGAVLLNVFGGKLTTYRLLAEKAVNLLAPAFPHCGPAWTALSPLPGGHLLGHSFEEYCRLVTSHYPWLAPTTLARFVRQYGSRLHTLLQHCHSISDLGQHFGHDLYEGEVRYLMQHEWAQTSEDILWRRTRLGLYLSAQEQMELQKWLLDQTSDPVFFRQAL